MGFPYDLAPGLAREEQTATGGSRKIAGWLWAGFFYVLVFVAGLALVGGGTVLATFAWGLLQNGPWPVVVCIVLMVAGVAVLVGGVVLLFRITSIPVPGRPPDEARSPEYYGHTDPGVSTHSTHGHHHDGASGGN